MKLCALPLLSRVPSLPGSPGLGGGKSWVGSNDLRIGIRSDAAQARARPICGPRIRARSACTDGCPPAVRLQRVP